MVTKSLRVRRELPGRRRTLPPTRVPETQRPTGRPRSPRRDLAKPEPTRASASFVDSATPLEDLPCFTQGSLGAGAVLDLARVFLETGNRCAIGSRHHIACVLGWVATKVPPRPGAETWPRVFGGLDKTKTTSRLLRSRGRLPQQISGQDGGGRDQEEWWLEDGVDSKSTTSGQPLVDKCRVARGNMARATPTLAINYCRQSFLAACAGNN